MKYKNRKYESLLGLAEKRQKKNLKILNSTLEDHYKAGDVNFTISHIARLSKSNYGPSESTIRNKTGKIYRDLIESWKQFRKDSEKNSENSLNSRTKEKDFDILMRIDDPAVRAIVGGIISENNQLLQEVNLLKAKTNILIDKRPLPSDREENIKPTLNEMEISAIGYAVSKRFLDQMGWSEGASGQVLENDIEIYPHGYILALKKFLVK